MPHKFVVGTGKPADDMRRTQATGQTRLFSGEALRFLKEFATNRICSMIGVGSGLTV